MSNSLGEEQALAEAIAKADANRARDPFPRIPPALLNSADIEDYATRTAMVHPFDAHRLKSASYSVRVGEKVILWEGTADGNQYQNIPVKRLAPGEQFSIPKNSVVFVQTEEIFQLPYYMAARFNLQISLVHKGLLLGTGPLVDPGFRGELLVPLHNLTENDYALCRGNEFIWVEFTKLSPNEVWDTSAVSAKNEERRIGAYRPYRERHGPEAKRWPSAEDFIQRALRSEDPKLSPHCGIRNSLPKEIERFSTTLEDTGERLKSVEATASRAQQAAFIVPVLALLAALFAAYISLVTPVAEARVQAARAQEQVGQIREEIQNLKNVLNVAPQSTEIDKIEQRLNALEARSRNTLPAPTPRNPN